MITSYRDFNASSGRDSRAMVNVSPWCGDRIIRFGGAAHGKKEGMIQSMVLPILRSPEYSLLDIAGYARGAYYNLRELWREVITCKFDETVKQLSVPVFITQGRHDRNTPSELAKRWFDSLDAPNKTWIWFEESAHSPIREEKEKWNQTIRTQVFWK